MNTFVLIISFYLILNYPLKMYSQVWNYWERYIYALIHTHTLPPPLAFVI